MDREEMLKEGESALKSTFGGAAAAVVAFLSNIIVTAVLSSTRLVEKIKEIVRAELETGPSPEEEEETIAEGVALLKSSILDDTDFIEEFGYRLGLEKVSAEVAEEPEPEKEEADLASAAAFGAGGDEDEDETDNPGQGAVDVIPAPKPAKAEPEPEKATELAKAETAKADSKAEKAAKPETKKPEAKPEETATAKKVSIRDLAKQSGASFEDRRQKMDSAYRELNEGFKDAGLFFDHSADASEVGGRDGLRAITFLQYRVANEEWSVSDAIKFATEQDGWTSELSKFEKLINDLQAINLTLRKTARIDGGESFNVWEVVRGGVETGEINTLDDLLEVGNAGHWFEDYSSDKYTIRQALMDKETGEGQYPTDKPRNGGGRQRSRKRDRER